MQSFKKIIFPILVYMGLSLFIYDLSLAAQSCNKLSWEKRLDLKSSDFKTFLSGAPKSEEGFVTTVDQVPLTSKNLLKAYELGIYPWNPESTGKISWYSPKNHGIMEIEPLVMRKGKKYKNHRNAWNKAFAGNWTITFNKAFEEVIQNCAKHERPNYDHVWLVEEVQRAYIKLHKEGKAHSVEVWDANGNLIGGTYGIYQKGLFSAESMFHKVPDAGKVAVFSLLEKLHETGHRFVDTQTVNDNTRSNYHAYHIPRMDYLKLIESEYVRVGDKDAKSIFEGANYKVLYSGGPLESVSSNQ